MWNDFSGQGLINCMQANRVPVYWLHSVFVWKLYFLEQYDVGVVFHPGVPKVWFKELEVGWLSADYQVSMSKLDGEMLWTVHFKVFFHYEFGQLIYFHIQFGFPVKNSLVVDSYWCPKMCQSWMWYIRWSPVVPLPREGHSQCGTERLIDLTDKRCWRTDYCHTKL